MARVDRGTALEAAAVIRRILLALEADNLTAPAAVVYRLEGVVIALERLGEETGRLRGVFPGEDDSADR